MTKSKKSALPSLSRQELAFRNDYFSVQGTIWSAYFNGKISAQLREARLRPMREELSRLRAIASSN